MRAGAQTKPDRAPNVPAMCFRPLHLNPVAAILLLIGVVAVGTAGCTPLNNPRTSAAPRDEEPSTAAATGPRADLSGQTRFGDASFYAGRFAGREMADGSRMDPRGDNAASKTLPLGTTARVTNIETGESAVVTIRDRGPYAHGRIVELSPSTARKIGITKQSGIAKVSVAPISIPLPDGSTKRVVAAPTP